MCQEDRKRQTPPKRKAAGGKADSSEPSTAQPSTDSVLSDPPSNYNTDQSIYGERPLFTRPGTMVTLIFPSFPDDVPGATLRRSLTTHVSK